MNPIKLLRYKAGLTQKELAVIIGVNYNTVLRWEKGGVPRPKALVHLAKILGTDSSTLLDAILNFNGE